MQTERMMIDGMEIEYYDSGKASKTLVFVHGLGGSIRQWREQIEFFEKEYRVIGVSFQGHGNSDKPNDPSRYTLDAYSHVAIELLNQLEVQSCVWIGNSMGGVIGYKVLEKQASLVEKLVTNGTAPAIEMPALGVNTIVMMDKLLIKIFGFQGLVKFASNHTSKNDQANANILECMLEAAPITITSSHRILGNYNFQHILDTFGDKVVILRCDEDKDINKYIKNCDVSKAKVIDFYGVGHIFNVEDAKRFNDAVSEIIG